MDFDRNKLQIIFSETDMADAAGILTESVVDIQDAFQIGNQLLERSRVIQAKVEEAWAESLSLRREGTGVLSQQALRLLGMGATLAEIGMGMYPHDPITTETATE